MKKLRRCLIGHTGFVGSNISRQLEFDEFYNSTNIEDIRTRDFSDIYSAGNSSLKWWANENPAEDRRQIDRFISCLEKVRADRFVLISTIDVFARPYGVDESTSVGSDDAELSPYGRHRVLVEEFVRSAFQNHLIIRLPNLFGAGLKKNVVFDFLHTNQVDKIHADAVMQWYDLDQIVSDIDLVIDARQKVINFATEPISVRELASKVFNLDFDNRPPTTPVSYDVQTRHAGLFRHGGRYIADRSTVIKQLRRFVDQTTISSLQLDLQIS